MIEGESIEMVEPLERPGILRIHRVAYMRFVQGQGAGFPVHSVPDGGLARPAEPQLISLATAAPGR